MIIDGLLGSIGNILGWVLSIIPSLNIDSSQFGIMLTRIIDMSKALDVILPLHEALAFAVIIVGIKGAMMLFWGAMRLINLIRGAG